MINTASGSAMTVRRSARDMTSTETTPNFVMIGVPPHTKTVTSAPAVAREKNPTVAGCEPDDWVMPAPASAVETAGVKRHTMIEGAMAVTVTGCSGNGLTHISARAGHGIDQRHVLRQARGN